MSATSPNNPEASLNSSAPAAKEAVKPKVSSAEVTDALSSTAAEVAPGIESVEVDGQIEGAIEAGDEKVSEIAKETTSENKGDGSGAKNQTAAQIKSHLLKDVPSTDRMRSQLISEVKSEIRWLRRRSFFIGIGFRSGSAFELNNIVKKIRELRLLLAQLASATIEMLKNLWLRFVHGVM